MRALRAMTFAVSLAWASVATAQTSPTEIARRDLLDQAEAARAAGDHARALDLATRASQLRVTPSLRLLLAQEHQALGHVLEALDQSASSWCTCPIRLRAPSFASRGASSTAPSGA